MDGLELACRFSLITNSLHYCGPKEGPEKLRRYIVQKDNADEVREVFMKFEGLFAYLKVIADASGKDMLDYEVVEAYWLGNELLDALDDEHVKKSINLLMGRGLPKMFGEKNIEELPKGFPLHHDFNVLYVGVGKATASVPTTTQNMDNCRVSWGKVVKVMPSQLIVATRSLKFVDNQYMLGEKENKTIVYEPDLLSPDIGDNIAIHWGFACHILTDEQLSNLKKYSDKVRDVMNGFLSTCPQH